jgi:3-oxoacyl-[acyl-carrier-protein] synthase II
MWIVPDSVEDPEFGFDPDRAVPKKDQKKMDRFIQFAMMAADEAITQAGWTPQDARSRERTASAPASAASPPLSMRFAADERGVRRLSPFTVPAFLVNLAAGQVAIRHGFKGPLGAPVTACAAGVQAIGDAARLLLAGEADVAIAGGAEACIDRVSLGGFAAARALSTNFNDQPQRASRPFDRDRDGFVMGEGAGLVVIETLDHALSRGAHRLLNWSATAPPRMPII